MKKSVVLFLLFPLALFAQESERFVDKGLLGCKGTLAVGFPTAYKGTNMYISANMEYYTHKNISYRGGLYIFLGTSGEDDVLAKNHTLFTGFYYHFKTKNHLDPYIGLEPGVSWTQLERPDSLFNEPYPYNISGYQQTLSPVASFSAGINYYATKWSHLFIEAKYVYGIHASDVPAVSLSEVKLAFGFGFNIWAIKRK